jgi:hypothetical protein
MEAPPRDRGPRRAALGGALLTLPLFLSVLAWKAPWGAALFFLPACVASIALAATAPPGRALRLPAIVLAAAVATSVALAWIARVDEGLPLLPDLSFTVLLALGWVAFPALIGGLLCWRHRRHPSRGRLAGRAARTLLSLAVFAGSLLVAWPFYDSFHDRELDRAKRFVEALALEVDGAARSPGGAAAGVETLLHRTGDWPPLLRRRPLSIEKTDAGPALRFVDAPQFMQLHEWTYAVPSGPWTLREL